MSNVTLVQILRSVTSGKSAAHLHPVKIVSEEVSFQNKTSTFNKCYLIKKGYDVGWIMDADVQSCLSCDSLFNVIKRKHHCRLCGIIVCNDCCKTRIQVPGLVEQEPQGSRVCKTCFEKRNSEISAASPYNPSNEVTAESLLEKLKLELQDENGKPMDKLTHQQIFEISNALAAKSLEDVCNGIALPVNDNSIEIRVEELVVNGKPKHWNKAFLTNHKYKVGWVLYREWNRCIGCDSDLSIQDAIKCHCRLCGNMFCQNCSTNRYPLPVFPETGGSKVCDKCFSRAVKLKGGKPDITAPLIEEPPVVQQKYIDVSEEAREEEMRRTLGAKPVPFLKKLQQANESFRS
jgi:hypothetical protein